MNRLKEHGGKTTSYDEKGNITLRSDIGDFSYDIPEKPYAISGVNLSEEAIALREQDVTYSSFKRPLQISENEYTANFT